MDMWTLGHDTAARRSRRHTLGALLRIIRVDYVCPTFAIIRAEVVLSDGPQYSVSLAQSMCIRLHIQVELDGDKLAPLNGHHLILDRAIDHITEDLNVPNAPQLRIGFYNARPAIPISTEKRAFVAADVDCPRRFAPKAAQEHIG